MSIVAFLRSLIAPPPPNRPASAPNPLDRGLVELSERDLWTLRDAFAHVSILGRPGSGKTSGSASHLSAALVRDGAGGLVLSAKPEVDRWLSLARMFGREDDLLVIGPGRRHGFNWIAHAAATAPGGVTLAVSSLLEDIVEVAQPRTSSTSSSDPYWRSASGQLQRAALDVLLMAGVMPFSRLSRQLHLTSPTSSMRFGNPKAGCSRA